MSKKKMGFWSIVLLTINSIIGTGIFLSPGAVAQQAGTKAALIYLVAAVFTAVLAITFASAAKYVAKSGSSYAYAKAAYGKTVGQYVGITRFMAASIAWGAMGTFVVKQVLGLVGIDISNKTMTIGFLILIGVLLLINIIGTRLVTFISDVSTIGKVAALVITIVAGVVILIVTKEIHINEINTLMNDDGKPLVPIMTTTVFVEAVLLAFYAFTGFEAVASGSQDMENPEVNLPKAIPLAIAVITVIYVGIIMVGMFISPTALVESDQVVVLAGIFKNGILRKIVIGGAFVSMFGINVASSFSAPRVLEAMSNEGQVPRVFSKRTSRHLPLNAFLCTAAVAIVIPLTFNYDLTDVMIIAAISRFVQYLVVPLAVTRFYRGTTSEKVLDAKKNLTTDVIIPVIGFALSVFLLIKFDWRGKFSIEVAKDVRVMNVKAVVSMVIGYVVIPMAIYIYEKIAKKKEVVELEEAVSTN